MLFLTVWELIIIDIDDFSVDNNLTFDDLKTRIEQSDFSNELFYVHKTERGFHLYLMSRKLESFTYEAIIMRMMLGGDPAHGTNAIYSGTSIRLNKKPNDKEHTSKFIGKIGKGDLNIAIENIYNQCCYYLNKFGDKYFYETDSLFEIWNSVNSNNFGYFHVQITAPLLITENDELVKQYSSKERYEENELWDKIILTHTIEENKFNVFTNMIKNKFKMTNLYRIIEDENDYVVGVHIQESLYFISYKDLLVIDYDEFERIDILKEFCKNNPEYKFRVVKTNKGYHCFLTSKPMLHNDMESIKLQRILETDHLHMCGTFIRGYSVRLNRKKYTDKYIEMESIGNGIEIPKLVQLYKYHLELWEKYTDVPLYNSPKFIPIEMVNIMT
jgi:hypothetical protein